ncbi:MAG: 50S ribosomal protein L1 [Candidatus Omnitrophica bacterium CG_4_9_14_0_2_um_filter_42_8]|nr:MAG: 50S ribosomal protein L1 [Candidatus Omnitrophica bacterium CG22_combo_CG10-13_8_21_14_all_43_16]PJC49028.1 MAG: 50S ribosomal protein L1 [Candidatus Omnitrophica bacterium CG_4_9_14_0_2_um_filter_42_8]
MAKLTKKRKEIQKIADIEKAYSVQDAISALKKIPHPKFDETVELAFNMGIDPKQSDQMVRGTLMLPNGTGKAVKVLVLCKGEAAGAAKEAGAEYVGGDDLVAKISSGWMDFDVVISSPDMMRDVGKLGKVLGPRGLMPNPKTGTVTNDLGRAVKEAKAGKVEFKLDKQGNINIGVGKISFEEKAICENIDTVVGTVNKARPQAAKGIFIKKIFVSTTMGPGLKLDLSKLGTT